MTLKNDHNYNYLFDILKITILESGFLTTFGFPDI